MERRGRRRRRRWFVGIDGGGEEVWGGGWIEEFVIGGRVGSWAWFVGYAEGDRVARFGQSNIQGRNSSLRSLNRYSHEDSNSKKKKNINFFMLCFHLEFVRLYHPLRYSFLPSKEVHFHSIEKALSYDPTPSSIEALKAFSKTSSAAEDSSHTSLGATYQP